VLVEDGLYLTIFFVRQRFTEAKDDLRGTASVRGRQLCLVQTSIQKQQQIFARRIFLVLQRAHRRQVTAAVLRGQGLKRGNRIRQG